MEAIIFSASEFELGFGFGRVSEYYCSRDNRYGLGFPMVTGYQSYAGLQTRFRNSGTGFMCGSGIGTI